MTQKHNLTLQAFDETVQAAFGAWKDMAGLRLFFAKTRTLLRARNVNLVIYPGGDRCSAFGIHELDTVDLVPEMMRTTDIGWSKSSRWATSRAQSLCMTAFRSSDLYRRYYSPYGLLHGAARHLALADREGKLVIDRDASEPDFDAEELEVIDRLSAHLERIIDWQASCLPSASGRWWLRPGAAAKDDCGSSIDLAASRFGLTPAEIRLVLPLLKGTGLRAAASELGISNNTAKSRLRSIFEKTGTHRQAQLVSLLLSSARL